MKLENLKLEAVFDPESKTWVMWSGLVPGAVVQADNLKEGAKHLAKSFEVMFLLAVDMKIWTEKRYGNDSRPTKRD